MTEFRKSSSCSGSHCVEVGFQKSTHCADQQCVEVDLTAVSPDVLVRDSKDPGGPVLRYTADEWAAFIAGAKSGEFDV